MPRFRLTLAYDGTGFEGFQLQAGVRVARTVQGALEEALARLHAGVPIRVDGAGRTDAGVHAAGQVASCDLPRAWAGPALVRALNAVLPADLRAMDAAPAPPDFHARRHARSKCYRYTIDTAPVQLPQRRHFALHVPARLDLATMQAAALLFVGRRDFASLASSGSDVKTTVRTLTRSELQLCASEGAEALVYEVEGEGFLRKMVRSIVGGLLAVGRGALTPAVLEYELHARDRKRWPAPAPAHGLSLVRVGYEDAVLHYRCPEESP